MRTHNREGFVFNMATPPKRPHRLSAGPQLNDSFSRKEKKISIEGNIGELCNRGGLNTDDFSISSVLEIFDERV